MTNNCRRQGWGRGATEPGFGVELKRKLHDPGRWTMGLTGFGECLPRGDNQVQLADQTDEFGIPLLRIHCTWGENELAMRKDMAASAAEMLEAAGCKEVRTRDAYKEGELGAEPGLGIHEAVLIVGYMGELVREYVERSYPQLKTHFVEQPERLGLGHAVALAGPYVDDRPVLIILGDTIFEADLRGVLAGSTHSIGVKSVDDPRRFGIVETDRNGRVTLLVTAANNLSPSP